MESKVKVDKWKFKLILTKNDKLDLGFIFYIELKYLITTAPKKAK